MRNCRRQGPLGVRPVDDQLFGVLGEPADDDDDDPADDAGRRSTRAMAFGQPCHDRLQRRRSSWAMSSAMSWTTCGTLRRSPAPRSRAARCRRRPTASPRCRSPTGLSAASGTTWTRPRPNACARGIAPLGQVQADIVELHDQADHAIDRDGDGDARPAPARPPARRCRRSPSSLRAIAMISADRMKSVRIAPATCRSSSSWVVSACEQLAPDADGRAAIFSTIFSVASNAR